jgi:glycogen(starch) synthase
MRVTVLMFGWEFPPHISGGLGTACYGLTKSLVEEDVNLLFVVPKSHGDESLPLISASDVVIEDSELNEKGITTDRTTSERMVTINTSVRLVPYGSREIGHATEHIRQWNSTSNSSIQVTNTSQGKKFEFSGTYGPALFDEVEKYSQVAAVIGHKYEFDVIHAHDWLTYPAGIEAKKISGKPLVVHVHATEYDRAEEKNIDTRVFNIEKQGMLEADRVVAVSQWTKDILVSRYKIPATKIEVVHNGVIQDKPRHFLSLPKFADKVVTFLGRITWQKGPQYFIEAAEKVLEHFPDTHFIMAGSGDLLPEMIEKVAQLKMSSRFHFTGFLMGKQIDQVWNISDVYVMPSVSEPFGITPLEAIHAGVPVIVSNQSGVAEVINHAIKVDFWNTDELANVIINIIQHEVLTEALVHSSQHELETISWQKAAKQLNTLYHEIHEGRLESVH